MTDHTGIPDYPVADVLALEDAAQYRALFDETRMQIIDLLGERAATTSQLAEVLDRPKGTIGYHLGVLEEAGLITVVRTEKVRAIEAKYYGRTARTFDLSGIAEAGIEPNVMMATAAAEIASAKEQFPPDAGLPGLSTVRYARIPQDRAAEWAERLTGLIEEFITAPRAGDLVYGLAVALYPTTRPHLPDEDA